jgi:hypothetical protein
MGRGCRPLKRQPEARGRAAIWRPTGAVSHRRRRRRPCRLGPVPTGLQRILDGAARPGPAPPPGGGGGGGGDDDADCGGSGGKEAVAAALRAMRARYGAALAGAGGPDSDSRPP